MAFYTISGVQRSGKTVVAATADSAREALAKYQATFQIFPEVLVADEHGSIPESVLFERADVEARNA